MTDQNTTSLSQPTGFAVGQRARFARPDSPYAARFQGAVGTVESIEGDWRYLRFDEPIYGGVLHERMPGFWTLIDELEAVQ